MHLNCLFLIRCYTQMVISAIYSRKQPPNKSFLCILSLPVHSHVSQKPPAVACCPVPAVGICGAGAVEQNRSLSPVPNRQEFQHLQSL